MSESLLELVLAEEERDDFVRLGRGTLVRRGGGRADDGVLDELLVPE